MHHSSRFSEAAFSGVTALEKSCSVSFEVYAIDRGRYPTDEDVGIGQPEPSYETIVTLSECDERLLLSASRCLGSYSYDPESPKIA